MSGRQTLLTGLALTALAVATTVISFSAASSSGGVYVVSIGLFVGGLARIGLGVQRMASERDARHVASLAERSDEELLENIQAQLRRRGRIRIAIVAAAGLFLFVIATSLYIESVATLCDTAHSGNTLDARRAAMARARPRLTPLRILPGELSNTVRHCEDAASELARVDRGECPLFPIRGVACRCGPQKWPDDADHRCNFFACLNDKLSSEGCPEEHRH